MAVPMATIEKPFTPNSMVDYTKISEQQAQQYEARPDYKDSGIGGCYFHRMPACGNCCTGCSLNLQFGGYYVQRCMIPINSYLPFCFCVGCYKQGARGEGWSNTNLKGDNHIYKIDASNGTLVCFFVGQGSPCCVCEKVYCRAREKVAAGWSKHAMYFSKANTTNH
jgi:hypothetical protein